MPILILVIFLGLFVFARPTYAWSGGLPDFVWNIISYALDVIIKMLGGILLWAINFIIILSGYNNFLDATVVSVGWKLVRDVANMFYILIMLVIAFSVMLHLEQYSLKKMLPRLIFTALLVNFSKTIIGLLIDFSQVIMLTFVNAYAATAGGNFVTMFGIGDMLKLTKDAATNQDVSYMAAVGLLLAAVLIAIAVVVVMIFAAILLFRIITLWILIVLSPLAFLLGTFEKGKKYYAEWWDKLINQIIVGPIVAFFLWLSLATMGAGNQSYQLEVGNVIPDTIRKPVDSEKGFYKPPTIGSTEIASWENLSSFAVSIAMLFIALDMIGKLGVTGAGLAKSASTGMQSLAKKAVRKAAIPLALTALTGNIPLAMALRGAGKATIGAAQGLPIIGGAFKALAKKGDEYGLASEKGVGGWAGRTGREGVTKGVMGALGVVGGVPIIGAAALKRKGELAREQRKDVREGVGVVSELPSKDREKIWKAATFTDRSEQLKFAAGKSLLQDDKWVRTQKTEDVTALISNFEELGEKTGNSEDASKVIKSFKKENKRFNSDEELAKSIPSIHPGNLKNLDDMDVSDPRVVKYFTDEQKEKMSGHQRGLVSGALAQSAQQEALSHLGLKPEDAKDSAKVEAAIRDKGMPKQMSADMFKNLPTDLKVGAIIAGSIKSNEIDLKGMEGDEGKRVAEGVLNSGNEDAIKNLAGSNPEMFGSVAREKLEEAEKPSSGTDASVVKQLRQVAFSTAKSSDDALSAAGYTPDDDSFKPGGREALVNEAQHEVRPGDDSPPAWLKDMKVDAIVKRFDGKISGLTELGNVLAQNLNFNRLMLMATKEATTSQKHLAAALIAAKLAKAGQAETQSINKSIETPAFLDIIGEIENITNELKPRRTIGFKPPTPSSPPPTPSSP